MALQTTNFNDFSGRIAYKIKGTVVSEKEVEDDSIEAMQLLEEAWVDFEEVLGANMVNLDAYFSEDWAEHIHVNFDFEDRTFSPDWNSAEAGLHIPKEELIQAAEQRAEEDNTELGYVLGDWSYRAEKADHIRYDGVLVDTFAEVQARNDQPDDASDRIYGGGRYQ